jgi:hypothetical protein
MTCSLEALSHSHNIKDYKLEFNKVSRAVPITAGPHYSVALHFILLGSGERESDGASEDGDWVSKSGCGFLTH